MIIAIVVFAIIAVAAVWALLAAPSVHCRRCRKWRGTMFAHRGLHGDDYSENSLRAFERACENSYGMELDVQFSSDRHIVVFHDDDTLRMTGVPGLVREKTFEELRGLRLVTDGASIPSFEEVLTKVDSRQPLCVEIKNCPNIGELTRATVEMLRRYKGPFVVESFNPLCLWHLRRIAPDIIRGQLVTDFRDNLNSSGKVLSFALSALLLNVLGRPDFVAYNETMQRSAAIGIQRRIFKTPLAVWTVTNADSAGKFADAGEMPIFEKCRP